MGASFIICSMFYSSLLLMVYFSKRRLETRENKVYGYLLITNFVGLVISLFSYMVTLNIDDFPHLTPVINKLYLIYLLTFLMLFAYYTFLISFKNKINLRFNNNEVYKKIKGIFIKLYLVIAFALLLLPLYYESTSVNSVYSYGPGSFLCLCMSFICVIASLIFMIIGRKSIKREKFIPLIIYIIFLPISFIIQYYYPELLIMTPVETFITFLMYFTIENPDLKTIKELGSAKESLEESNNAKTKFLYNISHEIRTPLTNIIGFTDSLKEKNIDPKIKNDVENIEISSKTLLEVVNGILDLSKFDKNAIKVTPKNYDMKAMLDEIAEFSKEVIGKKMIEFRTSFDTSIPDALSGDYNLFRQIILNILSNAIERTEVGFIEFSASSIIKDNVCRIIISVEDTGGTVRQKKLAKIFEDDGEVSQSLLEGTTSSLSATYKLVKLMNGDIIAQNVYNRGLKVTVAIDQEIVEIHKDKMPEQPIDISGRKILIVDDNMLNIKVAERLLEKYNVNIKSVTSGQACLDSIRDGAKYDLILMDDMMPNMSGVETFKKLKSLPDFHTPTVMLTANAMEGMKEKYLLEDGFDDYIAKPIAKSELDRVIKKLLK